MINTCGVIKHGWLANPRTEWRFLARKITDFCGPFSSTPCLRTLEGTVHQKTSRPSVEDQPTPQIHENQSR